MTVPKLLGCAWQHSDPTRNKLTKPIILFRGLGRSSAFWLEFPEVLSGLGADVLMLDLLGMGMSHARTGRVKIQSFAQDVVHTLKHNNVTEGHLAGLSLGGMVALQAAVMRDGAFEATSLTIMASSSQGLRTERIRKSALLKFLEMATVAKMDNRRIQDLLVSQQFLQHNPQIAQRWNDLWQRERIRTWPVLQQLLAAALFDARPLLERICVPTQFIVSKDDQLVNWLNTVRLWERTAGAKLLLMDRIGHDLTTEDPVTLAKTIYQFAKETEVGIDQTFAMHSISTNTSLGSRATSMVERAGL